VVLVRDSNAFARGKHVGSCESLLRAAWHDLQGDDKKNSGLKPATMLSNVLSVVPELRRLSNVDLQIVCNKDSARMG
jgi:hypothetical protein